MVFTFGTFEFDDQSTELRKNGRLTALEPQPAKALAVLLKRAVARNGDRADDIVSREELRDAVWGSDTHVDFDRGLAYCISQIRSALGDSGENPRFIQTVPKRGFRFIAPIAPADVPVAGILPNAITPPQSPKWVLVAGGVLIIGAWIAAAILGSPKSPAAQRAQTVIGVSVFDNETGNPEYDRPVAGLSDLVVEHLTKVDPARIAVIGNAAILRQPRNIRNLQAVAQSLKADYVLLGQLQRGESGLRFITHFIRLADEKHLRANRLDVADPTLAGLEAAVVQEFDRAVRAHVLNPSPN